MYTLNDVTPFPSKGSGDGLETPDFRTEFTRLIARKYLIISNYREILSLI
jgi:hypothetical protein